MQRTVNINTGQVYLLKTVKQYSQKKPFDHINELKKD